ncbi:CapA family protein [Paenibacillus sacheonensis]|uniref:CapA family protein n=1 Tax=Paenibacillus sacheonensis TaxID=742054 RepID=A0A7X4YJK6_9BACL|nr:CapA family protein [Paenibacillus sacheonensis]MBM7564070.1 poly-gamma-glutamate synthesis protein (capsule biosynthesis protein) [Paenibacillus sacheonensis]NBC67598.1 CapA family protein [Paenibacillus sacheonensis]
MSKQIVVAAVGDLLMKPLLIKSLHTGAQAAGTGSQGGTNYAFEQMFEPVARYLQDAHLTIGNLETTFAGGREADFNKTKRNPKNRNPLFKSPDALAPALSAAGFDVFATANNHCADYGVRGLVRTLDVLDKNGLGHVGTYRSAEESRKLCVRNVEGIRIGILSYTRDTNGMSVPKGQPAGVKKLVRARMKNDMKRLRAAADFIIVCMHCGFEYEESPAAHQKEWVRFLFRNGADVVLGSHPHVLQPAITRIVKDVSGRTRKRFAIYSLGNFVSTRLHGKDAALTGIIVRLRLRSTNGQVRLDGIEGVPTWVGMTKKSKCRIVPLQEAIGKPDEYPEEQLARMKRAYQRTLRMYRGVLPFPNDE